MNSDDKQKSSMRITFLGTGTSIGVPVVACNCPVCLSDDARDKRLRTSAMVTIGGRNLVIDCGPDFRMQMLKNNVDEIDAILFTHDHRDHIAGLDDIRAFNYILNKKIVVYGTDEVMKAINTVFPYVFCESRFFGSPQISVMIIDENPFDVNTIRVIPIRAMHGKSPVLGFRINDFTYITDASYIPEQELDKAKGSKVIVVNALRNSKHISHFSLTEAIEIISQLNPEKAYITHISHFLGLHGEVEQKLPPNIKLAFDNLVVEL